MADKDPKDPVTLVFNWKVKYGKEKEFEKWAHETTKAANAFEGHLGANWIKAPNSPNYTLIYKFDTYEHFHIWEKSDIRKKLLQKGLMLSNQEKINKVQELTGLETWFTLPGTMTIKPPPKWKMMIATFLGIYPLILLIQTFVTPYLPDVPLFLNIFISACLIVPLMTFFVMPNITKLLRRWLFPVS